MSFETYRPLTRVLDKIGEVFGPLLEQNGIHWLTRDDAQRRDLAHQVLKQIPVLWIWDNVEPIAGFPQPKSPLAPVLRGEGPGVRGERSESSTTDTVYTAAEQRELADFLRDAARTKAKFLLTSRCDERPWLGDTLPCRIPVGPMPPAERVQLARAIAAKRRQALTVVDDWRPLLRFTEGNPLTLTVLVGQALRDGLKTREKIVAFVERLRSGEAAFDDEAEQGRSRSLGASLSYGFSHAFTEPERSQLAVLHLFQGFVDVDVLQAMGHPNADWCLPELRGLTPESGMAILDRAAEVGLLTAHGGGYYSIHPALPWFFKSLFDAQFATRKSETSNLKSEISNLQSAI